MSIGLYIHVPFCIRKCLYCDFISYPNNDEAVAKYLQGIVQEISLYQTQLSPQQRQVETIFIGGGTPTILNTRDLEKILDAVYVNFEVISGAEITIEGNPGTVNWDSLRDIRGLGVNRISFGAQAFQDSLLASIGRIHFVQDIYDSVHMARKVGFDNINIDLMFALPGQTMGDWEESLSAAVNLDIEHISAYSLKIEEGTPLQILRDKGKLQLVDEDLELLMMERAQEILREKGYQHYEISNYAKEGYQCRHNLIYWHNQEYLGLGPGAFSRMENQRYNNYSVISDYCNKVEKGKLPIENRELLTKEMEISETVFLALRLAEGVNCDEFQKRFGVSFTDLFGNTIDKFIQQGLLKWQGDNLKLTQRGLPIANMIFSEFLL